MAKPATALKRRGFGVTSRRDAWWLTPAVTFIVFASFIVYSTWAALQGNHYRWGPYLSPFYSPEVITNRPGWFPHWLPFSPALFILPFPALFRFTCYYYRGAYYKAFWADPPACGVSEPRKGFTGEHGWPLIAQNVHRYFFYAALIFLIFLWRDVIVAFDFDGHFGIGVGTLVLLINTSLLTCYTFSCHSLRHLIGGRRDCLGRKPVSLACYSCVSGLNKKHMLFAWLSLFMVGFADIYVRLVSMGTWHDWRIL
ncbi:MAG TPA: hypothetical protein VGL56_02325 [Fimbriimonadaceae bacterium]